MAVDFYLKIDGIKGESKDSTHSDEMQIQSWSWGESNSGSGTLGGGHGSGKVSMQDFHFVIDYGVHSPLLFKACAVGTHIPNAVLTCRKAGGDQVEYLTWKFTEVLISSYQTGGSAHGAELPTDQCSFNFTKIEMIYKEQKSDGSLGGNVNAGFDIKTNQAC
ncbi:MAG: type VI secretion system tube protein Hcp [Acidobacteriota bacterium]